MSDIPASKTATEKVVDSVKAAVSGKATEHMFRKAGNALVALGEDVMYQIFGHPVVDRILGREKIKEAEGHASEGNFQQAWESLHGHVNEKRRRFGRADLRAQRRLVTKAEASSFNSWMAGLPVHQRTAVQKYFEAYIDEDLQVTDLAIFIKMTPQERLDFMAAKHEDSLMDALRAHRPAVQAENRRLDGEYARLQAEYRQSVPYWWTPVINWFTRRRP